jgi:hypothetical protein
MIAKKGDAMPKKSNSRNENREHGGKNADRQDRAKKWKAAKVQARTEQPGDSNDYRQPIQEKPGNAAGLGYYRKLLQARRQQNREKRQVQGNPAKKGCLPKLFMLALPFGLILTCLIPGL